MSVTLAFTFPWGRYHANPWTRSNNEGAIEWPPSPWRILRALYSSWKLHAPELSAVDVESLLGKLCVEPTFLLPPHTETHTRHYLPGVGHLDQIKTDTDKTIDAFVVMGRNAVVEATWPVDLGDEDVALLRRLTSGVRYLGRAESIVEVAVTDGEPNLDGRFVSSPGAATGAFTLVPDGPDAVGELTLTPAQVRKSGRLVPSRARTVTYSVPRPRIATPRITRPNRPAVTAVRFSLSGAVKPSRFEAVLVGDIIHRAAVKRTPNPSRHLTGRVDSNTFLASDHQHVHYLSVPSHPDQSGRRIQSIVAWAPGGFCPGDVDGLTQLRQLRSRHLKGIGALDVVLVDSGDVANVAPELVGPSAVWVSVTPYSMIHRHKGDLLRRLHKDVARELAHRKLPQLESVELFDGPWLSYRRYRPGAETLRESRPAFGVKVTLAEPVDGPLAMGKLSHFGLGLFRPVR